MCSSNNPAGLCPWRANMDVQFVLNAYECAVNIVNYRCISKAQKGTSDTFVSLSHWHSTTVSLETRNSYEKKLIGLDTNNLPVEACINNDDNENDDEISEVLNKVNSRTKKRNKQRVIGSCWFSKESEPEKCYLELHMLFILWRNEETGLIGSFSSYQEQGMLLSNVISEQMEKYSICKGNFR